MKIVSAKRIVATIIIIIVIIIYYYLQRAANLYRQSIPSDSSCEKRGTGVGGRGGGGVDNICLN